MPRRQVTYSNHPNHRARMVHAQGERQFRTYDTSHIRPRKSKGPVIVGIVLAIVVVLALVFGVSAALKGCSGDNVDGSIDCFCNHSRRLFRKRYRFYSAERGRGSRLQGVFVARQNDGA